MSCRVRLDIEYDGTGLSGWQIQNRSTTVQGLLEKALALLYGSTVRIHGSGRTDAGVHALGQVAHAILPDRRHSFERVCLSLNALTPESVVVHSVREVEAGFDARRSARFRHYRYRLSTGRIACDRQYVWCLTGPLSLSLLNRCAEALPGTHHFTSFCVARSALKGTECRVMEARWRRRGRELHFDIRGDRFVHGMVRSLVGGMVSVAQARLAVDDFILLLHRPGRGRIAKMAPAHGLTLMQVGYDD